MFLTSYHDRCLDCRFPSADIAHVARMRRAIATEPGIVPQRPEDWPEVAVERLKAELEAMP